MVDRRPDGERGRVGAGAADHVASGTILLAACSPTAAIRPPPRSMPCERDLDRVQLQLNRGEARHDLARRLFFANQGRSAPATTSPAARRPHAVVRRAPRFIAASTRLLVVVEHERSR